VCLFDCLSLRTQISGMTHPISPDSVSVETLPDLVQVLIASRPLGTLRNELMHPNDKVDYEEVSKCIYQISCKNCDKVYVGETARNLRIRVGEHKKWSQKIC